MVNIYETATNLRINAGLLKTLSGDDETTARGLHQSPITFLPQFTIWLATNYRPHVPHDDNAAWGRLREVPFTLEIPKNERDPKVREALRNDSEHRAAVLAWIVEGTRHWIEEGLETPEAVKQATQSFKNEMDPLAQFLVDCCETGDDMWVKPKDLRTEYLSWCEESAVDPVKGTTWTGGLEARGFKYGWVGPKAKRVRAWTGVGLKNEPEDEF